MVRHTVLWTFHEGLSDDRVNDFRAGVEKMVAAVPSIARAAHGRALRLQPGPVDYVLQLDFADSAGFDAYKQHAAHRQFIEDQARECVADTARAQFEVV